MKVLVAEKCGFCLGVKNAIKMAQEFLKERHEVHSLGPVIHNEDVVAQLARDGLKTVDKVEDVAGGTVLIRSHGASLEQIEKIKQKGLEIADATCVLVKRVQKLAKQLSEGGYKVVIIGDKNHPEVQGVMGYAPDIYVVADEADIAKLPRECKLGVICQTTQSPEHFGEMVGKIAKRGFSELKVVNTLCREAMLRQESAVELCKRVDVMFVLGGLHSANTRKLAEMCKKYNKNTFHLQNWAELDKTILSGKEVAGVTAGASTPDEVIQEFVSNLEKV
ncbi:MAG: 4-hydroxy-3-methylbut-2-enyl diphosphate reductase [Planctomycetes bacterium GWF2_50_10]|nr:MAG: 4-hydroxy-3-methylbut-2-enyl diphosphate reductase [Planctomycetes bacterium GWF2_50_10]